MTSKSIKEFIKEHLDSIGANGLGCFNSDGNLECSCGFNDDLIECGNIDSKCIPIKLDKIKGSL